jgi:hypothetical protein
VRQAASLPECGTFYPDPLLPYKHVLDFLQVVQRTLETLIGKRIIRLQYLLNSQVIICNISLIKKVPYNTGSQPSQIETNDENKDPDGISGGEAIIVSIEDGNPSRIGTNSCIF